MVDLLPDFIGNNLQWWLGGIIVVGGLLIYGFSDLFRFSIGRVWAISGVCFDESIRRKVLWIAPMAMLGVIVVCQLQRSIDEQDTIRQTIKFSLFAAGMVVTTTTIILGCTNLPKEIDSRVIYTIVTKPTTRLEIIVGKVIGFAKVSAATLAIMGIFSLGYLHSRAWLLRRGIVSRLQTADLSPASIPTYKYWADNGLLSSRTFEHASDLQVYALKPAADDTRRWFFGKAEGDMAVPFHLSLGQLIPADQPGANPGDAGLFIQLRLGFDRSDFGREDPTNFVEVAPAKPSSASVAIRLVDPAFGTILGAGQINGGKPIELTDPSGSAEILVPIDPNSVQNLVQYLQGSSTFYVDVIGVSGGVIFGADTRHEADVLKNPVCLIVPGATPQTSRIIGPIPDGNGLPGLPKFMAHGGLYGMDLRGGPPASSPVAQYKFRGARPSYGGDVAFELRGSVERGTEDQEEAAETRLELTFVDKATGQQTGRIQVAPENRRTTYFDVPAAAVGSGDFDLYVRNLSIGHYVGLKDVSISLVSAQESFDFNLVKSLFILWMLSVLVVIMAIFCSTFLSWPIAVVLTLFLLLGHWGVLQLGDAMAPGIGNRVATDMFGSTNASASQARVVSSTVEAMTRLVTTVSSVLPDIEAFAAIEDIEQGISIGMPQMFSPMMVLVAFGLPILSLSYVVLRNKEVAP